jgi:hypothetical protein
MKRVRLVAIPGSLLIAGATLAAVSVASAALKLGGGGSTVQFFNDFRQVMPNPCPASGE